MDMTGVVVCGCAMMEGNRILADLHRWRPTASVLASALWAASCFQGWFSLPRWRLSFARRDESRTYPDSLQTPGALWASSRPSASANRQVHLNRPSARESIPATGAAGDANESRDLSLPFHDRASTESIVGAGRSIGWFRAGAITLRHPPEEHSDRGASDQSSPWTPLRALGVGFAGSLSPDWGTC
jgi:hypothetical protein